MAARADSTGAPAMPLAPISSNIIPFNRGGCPEGIEPRVWRKALRSRVQQHLGVVTALLRLLDDMDGDVDLEPSLAGFGGESAVTDDREGGDPIDEGEPDDWDNEDSDADEDNGDKEPSLGGLAVMLSTGKLIVDGEGDESDLEYSQGVDCAEAPMTEWSPEQPVQTVPGLGE